jgi:ribonuclease M5
MVTKMKKLKIAYPIIVEGKYDRMKLLGICEGLIIKTDGFGVFKKEEKAALIRTLAKNSPIIVLTDSDGGGRVIRSHISSLVPKDKLIQLYIPKIEGKEKRKSEPSKEGTLGVEGMENELLYNLLAPFSSEGNDFSSEKITKIAQNPLSKVDFFVDGLTGGENSSQKRDELAKKFDLPNGMTPNALIEALKVVATYEEYLAAVGRGKKLKSY